MSYKSLYDHRQAELTEYLPRSWYIQHAEMLQWVRNITIKVDDNLDKRAVRGFIVRRTAEHHGGISRFDYKIIIAGDQSPEMERFVAIKELMHCYFGPTPENLKYATDSAIVLETHARQIFGDSAMSADSPHVKADKMAVWMAVGVLCPEHTRKSYAQARASNQMTVKDIAAKQRIPHKQASQLISEQYSDELAAILN